MFIITFKGAALHHYGEGWCGWGPRSSVFGHLGHIVQFATLEDAQRRIDTGGVFYRDALVQELT